MEVPSFLGRDTSLEQKHSRMSQKKFPLLNIHSNKSTSQIGMIQILFEGPGDLGIFVNFIAVPALVVDVNSIV